MSKIIYWVHTSVDGFIDGPNGEFDWPLMGPELSAYSESLDERVDMLLVRPVGVGDDGGLLAGRGVRLR